MISGHQCYLHSMRSTKLINLKSENPNSILWLRIASACTMIVFRCCDSSFKTCDTLYKLNDRIVKYYTKVIQRNRTKFSVMSSVLLHLM